MTEMLKWGLFGVLVVSGMSLNYVSTEQLPAYAKMAVVFVMFALAVGVAYKTNLGQKLLAFIKSAVTELRKVVWPTRQETMQVSVIVIIMVIIMSLILWGFDMILFNLIAWFTGQGA